MGRQCYLVLDLFLLELQCLGWTEKSDAKDIEDGNINIESNLGSTFLLTSGGCCSFV
jgi:hypothetical protein